MSTGRHPLPVLPGRDGEREFEGGAKRDTRETDRKGVVREKEYGELNRKGLKKTNRGGGNKEGERVLELHK